MFCEWFDGFVVCIDLFMCGFFFELVELYFDVMVIVIMCDLISWIISMDIVVLVVMMWFFGVVFLLMFIMCYFIGYINVLWD